MTSRILVIEDQRRLAGAIARGLDAEGFEAEVAYDGTEGLRRARQHPFDAIVLDILLPGINGYKVCERLRSLGIWTPILMLSAKAGEWDQAEALDTGADDFLAKPFSYVVLVAHLRALLRRDRRSSAEVLRAGDLVLRPSAQTCERAGVDVKLTPRERTLLEYLMRHPGEVVAKGDILDHVWDFDFEGDDNIVEVYIRYLRNKIDRPFGRRSIETLRGVGYRLIDDV